MHIWVLSAWSADNSLMNEVVSLLFDEDLVRPKVVELLEEDTTITTVKVERWYREEGTDDASYYGYKMFYRDEME